MPYYLVVHFAFALFYHKKWLDKSLMPYYNVVHFAFALLFHIKWLDAILESFLLVTTSMAGCVLLNFPRSFYGFFQTTMSRSATTKRKKTTLVSTGLNFYVI
jgi:hypothetical protein